MATTWDQFIRQIGYTAPPPSAVSPFASMNSTPMFETQYQQGVGKREQAWRTREVQMAEMLAQANPDQEVPVSIAEMRPLLIASLARTFPQMTAEQLGALDDQQLIALAGLAGQQNWQPAGATPPSPQPPPSPIADVPRVTESGGTAAMLGDQFGTADFSALDRDRGPAKWYGNAPDGSKMPTGEPKAGDTITDGNRDTWQQMYPKLDLELALSDQMQMLANPAYAQHKEKIAENIGLIQYLLYELYDVEPPKQDDPQSVWSLFGDALIGLSPIKFAKGGKEAAGAFIALSDEPRKILGRRVGSAMLLMESKAPGITMASLGPGAYATLNMLIDSMGGPEVVQQVYDQSGLVGVWERLIAATPEREGWGPWRALLFHALTDIGTDPLTYTGAAATATKGVPILGKTMEAINLGVNLPGDAALFGIRQGIGAGKQLPGIRQLTQLSDDAIRGIDREALTDITPAVRSAIGDEADTIGTIENAPPMKFSEAFPSKTTAQPQPPAAAPSGPNATKTDPFADLAAMGTEPTVPPAAAPAQEVIRYLDGTPLSRDDLSRYEVMTAAGERPEDVIAALSDEAGRGPIPPRPVYADEAPFTDAHYNEYLRRIKKGEDPDTIIEDIYRRTGGNDPAPGQPRTDPKPGGGAPTPNAAQAVETVDQAIRPTKTDPLADLMGEGPTRPPEPPSATLPRPRHFDGTLFDDAQYDEYIKRVQGNGDDPDAVIREISSRALEDGTVPTPGKRSEPTPVTPRPPTDLNPIVGADPEQWAQMLADGDANILDWLVGGKAGGKIDPSDGRTVVRRLSDRLHKAALKAADISPELWNGYVDQARTIFRQAIDEHDRIDSLRYTNGAFYQKVAERTMPLYRGLIRQIELSRRLGLPADKPTLLRELPEFGSKATAGEETKKAIENAGPALLERLVFGTDAQITEAKQWIKAANLRNIEAWSDEGWVTKFLQDAAALRKEYQAAQKIRPGRGSSAALGITAGDVRKTVGDAYGAYADYVGRGKKPVMQVAPDDPLDEKIGDSLATRLYNVGRISNEQWEWMQGTVDLAKAAARPNVSKQAKSIIDAMIGEGIERPTRGQVIERVLTLDLPDTEFQQLTAKVLGIQAGEPTWWGKLGTLARHGFMYNWPRAIYNATQDWVTDWFTHSIDDTGSAVKLQRTLAKEHLRTTFGKTVGKASNEQPALAGEMDLMRRLGIHVPSRVLGTHGAHYSNFERQLLEEGRTLWSVGGEKVGRKVGKDQGAAIGKRLGQAVAGDVVMKTRSGLDDVKRAGSFFSYIRDHLAESREDWFAYLRSQAPKLGIDEATLMQQFDQFDGVFSPDDVRRVLKPYKRPGVAEHLAREWRARLSQLEKGGVAQGDRLLFTYRQTRFDKAIGSFYLFHYWMSRASALHGRLALEHPWLLATYYRTWEGSKRIAEQHPEYPQWAGHFIGLNIGPYGALGFVSPAALLTGLATVIDINGIDPNDPIVQQVLTQLPMAPILSAAASVYLNDRLPDPFGLGPNRVFAKAATNALRMIIPGMDPGYVPDFIGEGTYALQSLARQFAPYAEPLEMPSPTKRDQQQIWQYAAKILQERGELTDENGVPTETANVVAANILAGLYSGEIEAEAWRQWTVDSITTQGFRAVLPVQGQVQEAGLTNAQLAKELRTGIPAEVGRSTGIRDLLNPTPTLAHEQADYIQDVAYAGSPEAVALNGALRQYNAIGTEEQRERWRLYNTLIYDPAEASGELGGSGIVIGGQQISWATWDQMGENARRTLMDQWVREIGASEEMDAFRAERKAFEEAHPDVAEFKVWQRIVGKDPQAALQTLEASPSFMAWWSGVETKSESMLLTPDAFLAASGIRPKLYGSQEIGSQATDPTRINLITDRAGESGGSGSGSSTPSFERATTQQRVEIVNRRIMEYQAELEAFDAAIAGITGGRSYASYTGMSRTILDTMLKNYGIKPPSMPQVVDAYLTWAQNQPAGADTSVAAYVAWYESSPLAAYAA